MVKGLIRDYIFGNEDEEKLIMAEPESETAGDKRIEGTITHVDERGFGFIISPELKFTRIFFHWSALEQDTLNFLELKKRMKVSFFPRKYEASGWRAIKVRVLTEETK